MEIIKLNATNSTNSFLKDLLQNSTLKSFTVVVAEHQTKGRGQLENKWLSEPCKNLTFSVFVAFSNLKIVDKKYLNFAVSLAVYHVLINKKVPNITIKWANDILSANKKICGILIENTFSGDQIKNSVIGIGLNVNQLVFPKSLKNVTSLKLETNLEYNLDDLLNDILIECEKNINLLVSKEYALLEERYLAVLYKKNVPTMFKNSKDEIFMGMISGIAENGNLCILLEDNSIKEFGIKEVSFL